MVTFNQGKINIQFLTSDLYTIYIYFTLIYHVSQTACKKSNIEQCKTYPIYFGEMKHEID